MLSTPGPAVKEQCTESQRFKMTFGYHIELHKPPKTASAKHGVPAWIFRLGTDLDMLIKGGAKSTEIDLSTFISRFLINDSQNTSKCNLLIY